MEITQRIERMVNKQVIRITGRFGDN